jgi:putative SOS response-associated peptidase YedK
VLAREAWAAWLAPSLDADGAVALLGVPLDDGWIAEPVSPRVNTAVHDDEQCIAPMAAPAQGSLF